MYTLSLLVALAAALALRLPRLDLRPMHGDEAVHAVKFDELWRTGRYVYDPHEYHGPTLYYATLPAVWLSGAADFAATEKHDYRIVPVVFGVGLILLPLLLADGLGRPATAAAALLTAVSPVLVFYSRYYIQEALLVFFTLLLIAAGWRSMRSRRVGWATLAGVAAGCLHATKETSVIVLAALGGALGVCAARERWTQVRAADAPARRARHGGRHALLGAAAAVLTSAALHSAGFTQWRGPTDALRAVAEYAQRAGGGLHEHAWYYYLNRLLYWQAGGGPVWSEALIVGLAVVGAGAAIWRAGAAEFQSSPRDSQTKGHATPDTACSAALTSPYGTHEAHRLAAFLAVYALLLWVAYSLIPYKTPWCVLGPSHALVLLAGVGVAKLWRWADAARWRRAAVAVLLLAGIGHLGWQAWRGSQHRLWAADPRNPWIYAHPVRDVENLAQRLDDLAAVSPAGRELLVNVFVENPWPLPWYLRGFERVGYWEQPPAEPITADLVLASSDWTDRVEPQLQGEYTPAAYGLRRDEILYLYVRGKLWNEYLRDVARMHTAD